MPTVHFGMLRVVTKQVRYTTGIRSQTTNIAELVRKKGADVLEHFLSLEARQSNTGLGSFLFRLLQAIKPMQGTIRSYDLFLGFLFISILQ